MSFCPECGMKNDDDARFCANCGTQLLPLKDKDETEKTSQFTSNRVSTGSNFQSEPQSQQSRSSKPSYTQRPSYTEQGQYQQNTRSQGGYEQPQRQPQYGYQQPRYQHPRSEPYKEYHAKKSLILAVVLSAIPGLGLMYVGKFGRGLAFFFGVLILTSFGIIGTLVYIYQFYDAYKMADNANKQPQYGVNY